MSQVDTSTDPETIEEEAVKFSEGFAPGFGG